MTRSAPIISVVDDDESFRGAVGRLLRAAGYEVRTYASVGHFLLLNSGDAPGCLVLDVSMPGPSGLDLQDALSRTERSLPIIFLTGRGDIPMSVRAMRGGAVDFLTKPVKREILLETVKTAVALDLERRERLKEMGIWRARYESLTSRERAVLAQVIAGKLNKQIAGELGASERTIKAHRAHIMEKMQITSVAQLVRVVDQLQAVSSPAH
jgi:FixJ family two-component response regulator